MVDLERELLATPAAELWKRIGIGQHHGIVVFLPALRTARSCGIGEYLDLLPLIDWCHELSMDVIQLLPLGNSDNDPSPYNPTSSFALNFLFLSLDALPFLDKKSICFEKLKTFKSLNELERIDYPAVYEQKNLWLRSYFEIVKEQVLDDPLFKKFSTDNAWLKPFALFSTLKKIHRNAPVESWPDEDKSFKESEKRIEEHADDVLFYTAIQFFCFEQLKAVKTYAEKKKILLKGDIPILVSKESADVWLYPHYFNTDLAAGAPPDYYFSQGQYWGFPLYRWNALREDDFLWWKQRLKYAAHFFDLFRIDHVIGFFRIWAIPLNAPASKGHYVPEKEVEWEAQGRELLHMLIENTCGMMPIAEDLGIIPDVLPTCLREMGICGTKVMRWEREWDKKQAFIPLSNYPAMSLTCVSTHDSETLGEWWKKRRKEVKEYVQFKKWPLERIPLTLPADKRQAILWDAHHTNSLFHINLFQEYLALFPELVSSNCDQERINIPGTVSSFNWTYRYRKTLEEITEHQGLKEAIHKILFSKAPLI